MGALALSEIGWILSRASKPLEFIKTGARLPDLRQRGLLQHGECAREFAASSIFGEPKSVKGVPAYPWEVSYCFASFSIFLTCSMGL